MSILKYQKKFKKIRNNTLKTYFNLDDLIYDINNDKKIKKEDKKYILKILNHLEKRYKKLFIDIEEINFKNIKSKDKVKEAKPLNNLLVLPLYEDEDIFVNLDDNILDIFNKKD